MATTHNIPVEFTIHSRIPTLSFSYPEDVASLRKITSFMADSINIYEYYHILESILICIVNTLVKELYQKSVFLEISITLPLEGSITVYENIKVFNTTLLAYLTTDLVGYFSKNFRKQPEVISTQDLSHFYLKIN